MAFVADHGDPSGLGMFSKAGRFTSEKYSIFQRKDEILKDQKKYKKVSSLPTIRPMEAGPNKEKPEFDEMKMKKRVNHQKRIKEHFDPMSRTLTREERDRNLKEKHPPPPVGVYTPKDDLISPKTLVLFQYPDRHKLLSSSPKAKRDLSPKEEDRVIEEMTKPVPEKPRLKVKGYYSLDREVSRELREKIHKAAATPHDERFKYIDYPPISTKHHKVTVINFEKVAPRNFSDFFKSLEYAPDYAPNYEFGKRRIGSTGPGFDKMSPRKPYYKIAPSTEGYTDYERSHRSESSIFSPKLTSPEFNKMLGREADPLSPLPSFMQTINSRMSMGMLTRKTLISNNYSDGKFNTVYSSFSPKKSII